MMGEFLDSIPASSAMSLINHVGRECRNVLLKQNACLKRERERERETGVGGGGNNITKTTYQCFFDTMYQVVQVDEPVVYI